VLSRDRFLHTDSYLGLTYSDDFIYLEITFLLGRSKETKLRLLSVLNERIVEKLGINPDDLMTLIHEIPPENCSFGRGVAQRINVVQKP
jgi:phenylpyruvate tautomerase PptA (4-oxalocrotonate tautomerase family)